MEFNLLPALVSSFYQPGFGESLGVLTWLRILGEDLVLSSVLVT